MPEPLNLIFLEYFMAKTSQNLGITNKYGMIHDSKSSQNKFLRGTCATFIKGDYLQWFIAVVTSQGGG